MCPDLLDSLLNLIYPERCYVCSRPIARRRECGICAGCRAKVAALKIKPPRCPSCGLPFRSFQDTSEHLCGNCILHAPPYSGARSFGYYSAELSRTIQGFKFQGKKNFIGLLAPLLEGTFLESWTRADFDLLMPVPLHPKRRRERGYNQSEILARSLARRLALPWSPALARVRPTAPQVGLTDAQRQENVRGAFHCRRPEQVSKRRILLIDDVMTTGATVASAAKALLDAGALRVSVLTVARAARW